LVDRLKKKGGWPGDEQEPGVSNNWSKLWKTARSTCGGRAPVQVCGAALWGEKRKVESRQSSGKRKKKGESRRKEEKQQKGRRGGKYRMSYPGHEGARKETTDGRRGDEGKRTRDKGRSPTKLAGGHDSTWIHRLIQPPKGSKKLGRSWCPQQGNRWRESGETGGSIVSQKEGEQMGVGGVVQYGSPSI